VNDEETCVLRILCRNPDELHPTSLPSVSRRVCLLT
jgi:hypothetical protein